MFILPPRQDLSLNLELSWWPEIPNNLPVSAPDMAGVTVVCMWSCLAFDVGDGDLKYDLHAYTAQ